MKTEKKKLDVSMTTSTKISNTNTLFAVIGWIVFIVSLFVIFVGLAIGDWITSVIGCGCVSFALSAFVLARLFLGLYPMVKRAELENAILEKEYEINRIAIED